MAHISKKPCFGKMPIVEDRIWRDLQDLGCFLHSKSSEESQFDKSGFSGINLHFFRGGSLATRRGVSLDTASAVTPPDYRYSGRERIRGGGQVDSLPITTIVFCVELSIISNVVMS